MQSTSNKLGSYEDSTVVSDSSKSSWWPLAICGLFILIALAIAYQPVMFNFFCSDDFYIVEWLDKAIHNPLLLFQEIYSGTPYYRPLLNLFWFLEYLIFGANSCAFRLISLLYKLLTALVTGLLLKELVSSNPNIAINKNQTKTSSSINWYLFSTGLFLLYPLHTEPINWFVCTTDLLANLFILTSILFYLRWRRCGKRSSIFISCIFSACAFLVKEVTAILPAILLTYALLMNNNSRSLNRSHRQSQLHSLLITSPYWILLSTYLLIRKIVTGEFLGTWSNAVFHFPDNQSMYKAWIQSLKMIFIPLSSAAFAHKHIIYFAWLLIVICLAALTIGSAWKNRSRISLIIFLGCWFFLSLLPMYKLLLITPDLLDARYGYLASIPLCAFLMFGLAFNTNLKFLTRLRYPIFLSILSLSCFSLYMNNLAWAQAGKLTNNLLSEFRKIHQEIPGDPKIYFVNIPDRYNGVPIAGLQCSQCMNHKPFSNNNFYNGIWLLNSDQSLPLGFITHDLEQGKIDAHFYYLNIKDQHFYPVSFPKEFDHLSLIKNSPTIPITINNKTQNVHVLNDLGTPHIIPANKPTFTFSPKGLVSWPIDLIVLKVKTQNLNNKKIPAFVELNYTNSAQPNFSEANRLSTPLNRNLNVQFIIFPVRGIPIWSLTNNCETIQVSFPKDCTAQILGAYALSIKDLMPQIQFFEANYNKQTGQLTLSPKHSQATIHYDASSIKDCVGVTLEVIGPDEYFKELNSPRSNEHSLVQLLTNSPHGKIALNDSMLANNSCYKVRLRPIDAQGKQIGFCSDYFILVTNNLKS